MQRTHGPILKQHYCIVMVFHELAPYLIEKLPLFLRLTRKTFATEHEPWIGQHLFMKKKRILPEF